MDVDIISTTPTGSPLLAYGTSNTFPERGKFFAMLAAAIILILVVGISIYSVSKKITVPSDPIIVAIVPSGTHLPDSVPAAWKQATANSAFPVILGASIRRGQMVPFAAYLGLTAPAGSIADKQWPFIILTDHPLTDLQTKPWPVSELMFALVKPSGMSLQVRPSALGFKLPDITGPITSDGWVTSLAAPTSTSGLPNGDISIDLSALPDAAGPLKEALASTGIALPTDLPAMTALAVEWPSATTTGLRLDLQSQPSSSTSDILQHGTMTIARPYTLPDGTVVQDMVATTVPNSNASGTLDDAWVNNGLSWQTPGYRVYAVNSSLCIHGTPIFSLSEKAMSRIHAVWPMSLTLDAVDIASLSGHLVVCGKLK